MANLPEARPVREEGVETRVTWWPRFAMGLALIAIATALAFEFLKEPPVTSQMAVNSPETSTFNHAAVQSSAPEPLIFLVPNITREQFQALTTRLDRPLEKELENVISDTRQAIQFVASNFLPEK